MKKIAYLLTGCLLLSAAVLARAAGGDASDPLASLSYLDGSFTSTVDAQVNEKLNASDAALLESTNEDGSLGVCAATWAEKRLKAGDALVASTGTNALVLAGQVQVTFPSGTVVDVTTGTTVASGTFLTNNHRYMTAEDTVALFTVTSKTAVVDYQGNYAFTTSDATDYNALAAALKTLHLFKGSYTGYGDGFDLEVAPTRLQSLIMFIRVLGEEDAALAWTGTTPFTDLAANTQATQYVGYAYSMGYTNGYTANTFRPSQTITVNQYTEFLLRALGYSSTANTDLSATLETALENGVITAGEQAMLKNDPFLRAELVYLSYYALDATVSGESQTLGDVLQGKGVFTAAERLEAWSLAPGSRK